MDRLKLENQFTCRICGNHQNNVHWKASEMMYGLKDEFNYWECNRCKCVQIENFPENMSRYYPSHYYSFRVYDGKKFKGTGGWFKKLQFKSSVQPQNIFQQLIKSLFGIKNYLIFKDLSITKETRILDVGCGNGKSFLYPLAEIGFTSVVGCDPFIEQTIEYPNGLVIKKCDIEKMDGKWDIITWHHSFEHIPNPLENLQKASQILSEKGVCIIRIPTSSSYAWEHYRTNWVQLDAPRHFFLHSKESMEVLAAACGMELYQIQYDSTHFQFSGSEKYIKDIALAKPRPKGLIHFIKRKRLKRTYQIKARKLNAENRGDQAAFFLRKKN